VILIVLLLVVIKRASFVLNLDPR